MESANFVPLGDTGRRTAFDSATTDKDDVVSKQSRTIGKTKGWCPFFKLSSWS